MAVSSFTLAVLLIFSVSVSVEARCNSRVIAHDKQDSVNMTFSRDKSRKGPLFLEHVLPSSIRVEMAVRVRDEWKTIKGDKVKIERTKDGDLVAILKNPTANDAGKYRLTNMKRFACSVELIVIRKPVVSVTQANRRLTCHAQTTSYPKGHNRTMSYFWFRNRRFLTRSTSGVLPHSSASEEREITCVATEDLRCGDILTTGRHGDRLPQVLSKEACQHVLGWSTSYRCLVDNRCPCRSGGRCLYGRCSCTEEIRPVDRDYSHRRKTTTQPPEAEAVKESSEHIEDEEKNGLESNVYIAIGGVAGLLLITGLVAGAFFMFA